MKAFKIAENSLCRNIPQIIGKIYKVKSKNKLKLCSNTGTHYCNNIDDLFEWYDFNENTNIFEVEILGNFIDGVDKSITNKSKIIRELKIDEWSKLLKKYKIINNQLCKLSDEKYKYKYNSKGLKIYFENSYGYWEKYKYNSKGLKTYFESSNGYWGKYEYNSKGLKTYFENSDGDWGKYEYNSKGLKTYFECSIGYWEKYEYNSKGLLIYKKYSDGDWEKYEYNSKGLKTYYKNSDGSWEKYEYNENNEINKVINEQSVLTII